MTAKSRQPKSEVKELISSWSLVRKLFQEVSLWLSCDRLELRELLSCVSYVSCVSCVNCVSYVSCESYVNCVSYVT